MEQRSEIEEKKLVELKNAVDKIVTVVTVSPESISEIEVDSTRNERNGLFDINAEQVSIIFTFVPSDKYKKYIRNMLEQEKRMLEEEMKKVNEELHRYGQ